MLMKILLFLDKIKCSLKTFEYVALFKIRANFVTQPLKLQTPNDITLKYNYHCEFSNADKHETSIYKRNNQFKL